MTAEWVTAIAFRDPSLFAAARYAAEIAPPPGGFFEALRLGRDLTPPETGVLRAATRLRDRALLESLLTASNPPFEFRSYLEAVAGPADIPLLEKRIRSLPLPTDSGDGDFVAWDREAVESVLRNIRVEEIAGQ